MMARGAGPGTLDSVASSRYSSATDHPSGVAAGPESRDHPASRPSPRSSRMDELALRELIDQVARGRITRRRFTQALIGLGLSAPMAAGLLASAGGST